MEDSSNILIIVYNCVIFVQEVWNVSKMISEKVHALRTKTPAIEPSFSSSQWAPSSSVFQSNLAAASMRTISLVYSAYSFLLLISNYTCAHLRLFIACLALQIKSWQNARELLASQSQASH